MGEKTTAWFYVTKYAFSSGVTRRPLQKYRGSDLWGSAGSFTALRLGKDFHESADDARRAVREAADKRRATLTKQLSQVADRAERAISQIDALEARSRSHE